MKAAIISVGIALVAFLAFCDYSSADMKFKEHMREKISQMDS